MADQSGRRDKLISLVASLHESIDAAEWITPADSAMVLGALTLARKVDDRLAKLEADAKSSPLFASDCPTCGASGDDPCLALRGGKPIKSKHRERRTVEVGALAGEGGGLTFDLQQLTFMLSGLGLTPSGRKTLGIVQGDHEDDAIAKIRAIHDGLADATG